MDEKPNSYLPRFIDGLLDELLEQLPGLMIVGPRTAGKTTTLARRARTIVHLDREDEAAAFRGDPDATLRGLAEPVLLDEWQLVPGVLGAVRRAIDSGQGANRFYLSGSVQAEWEGGLYPGTGRVQRVSLYPMSVRELNRMTGGKSVFDRLVDGDDLVSPGEVPDLRGYVELALRGGFPTAAIDLSGVAREHWLKSYVEGLTLHDLELGLRGELGRSTDRERVRRYFEACAVNTAGVVDHRRIYEAASIAKQTGESYERMLNRLMVIERLPAWSSNRLKRLVRQPKRYIVDPSLVGAALHLDVAGVMADGDLLGRLIDTFVMAQLRPEVGVSVSRPRLFHLRTQGGRQEVDVVAEFGGGRLLGIEIKAGSAPTRSDSRHLAWLRDQVGDRFIGGVVLHTGQRTFSLEEKIVAAPIATLWG